MLDYLSEVFMNLFVSVLMFFVMIYLLVLFDQSGIIHFILATGLHMIIRKRKFLFFLSSSESLCKQYTEALNSASAVNHFSLVQNVSKISNQEEFHSQIRSTSYCV